MADDRMKNDDREKNMGGGAGQKKDNFGQQTPGRKQQDDLATGHRDTGQQNQPGHGTSDKSGTGQGGGRQGQNR